MGEEQQEAIRVDQAEVAKVGAHMFDLFCRDRRITEPVRPRAQPLNFLYWLRQGVSNHPDIEEYAQDLARRLGVDVHAARWVLGMASRQDGVNDLIGMWPYSAIDGRKNAYWHDDRACPLYPAGRQPDQLSSTPRILPPPRKKGCFSPTARSPSTPASTRPLQKWF